MSAISVEKVHRKESTNQKPDFSTSPPPTTPLLRTNTGLVCSNKKRLDYSTQLQLKLNDRKLFNSFNNAFNIKKKNIIKNNKTLASTRKPNQPNTRKPEPSVKPQIKTILESSRSKNATKNIRSPVKSPPKTHVSKPDTELLSARQEYMNLELTSLKNMLSKQQELYKEMLNDHAESKNKDKDAEDSIGQALANDAEQLLVDEKEGIIKETKNEILIIQEPAPPEKQQTTPPKKVKFSSSTSPQPLDTSILVYQNNKENTNPMNYDTMLQNLTELLMTQITPFLTPASLAASTNVNIQKIQHKKEEFNDDQVLIIGQESVTENIGTEIVVGKDETTYGAIVSPQSPIVIHKSSVKPHVISPKPVEEKDEEYLDLWLPTSIISNIRSSRSAQLAFQRQVFNVDDDDVIEMKAVDQLLEDGIWDILDSVAKYVVDDTVDIVTNELCEFVDDYVDGLVSSELK